MKRLFVVLSVWLCLFTVCAAQDGRLSLQEISKRADDTAEALIQNFWGASFSEHPDRYFFNKMSRQADMGTGDYWPQAHAIDVVTDAYLRTKDEKYYKLFELWAQGMPRFNPYARQGRRNGDPWWNAYVDDMEWHCLALIRVYEATNNARYLNKARQIYADWIWTQWGPEDEAPWFGGITWKTDAAKSKNACSNGPAAIIAARLAQFASVDASNAKNKSADEYRDEALKIYQWERKNLWDSTSGAVFDNMNRDGGIGRFSLSYNQGTFIGAAVELFRLTKDRSLLDDAVLTARYTTNRMSRRNNGVLSDETRGDGALFHGIFFRYLANLIVLPELDDAARRELSDYVLRSATVLVREGLNQETSIFGGRWRNPQPTNEPSALNAHVTGCTLLAAAYKTAEYLERNDGDVVMTNPLNLIYKFEERDPVHRTAADPVVILYHDKYFLFSSHAAGYSYSDNLRDWTHMYSKMPLVKEWAPAVMVYDDYIYYLGFGNRKLYRTNDPINDKWELVEGAELPGVGDPDFFVDDDGRVYFLYGCSAGGPMKGYEVDPRNNFKRISDEVDLMPYNGKRLGWEVPGDRNEKTDQKGWNEGASMVHEGDYYYFFYATPGTEYTSYCTGAYVGKSPLGPFEPMEGSPYAIKPEGFFTGGGHGRPFKDRYGNQWFVASLIIGKRERFERRIGIFPAFYDNGYAHVITDDFDKPFVVPNRKVDFEKESILLGMNALTARKKATASSALNDMTPDKASDDDIRTWWSARTGKAGEWLQVDLGRPMNVEAVEVCFADEGFKNYRYDAEIPVYKYIVEGSEDGETWRVLVDRSGNTEDRIYELCATPDAERTRYLRVTNKTDFEVGQFSVSELRAFGRAEGKVPNAVENFKVARQDDRRRLVMSWSPQQDAVGYVVRWGATKDRINHASRVYGTSADYGCFDAEQTYYVTVQAFNEVGYGEESEVVEVK